MDAAELKALKSPLRERYREAPGDAVITLSAEAELSSTEIACSVQTGQALVAAGLHPATGGDGTHACSGDMLLQALAACAGVTLRSVAVKRGTDVSGAVRVEGDLDVRGTLGVDRSAPVGFRSIRLTFELDSECTPEQVDELIATTERYCVVYQTLATPPALSIDFTGGSPSGTPDPAA